MKEGTKSPSDRRMDEGGCEANKVQGGGGGTWLPVDAGGMGTKSPVHALYISWIHDERVIWLLIRFF